MIFYVTSLSFNYLIVALTIAKPYDSARLVNWLMVMLTVVVLVVGSPFIQPEIWATAVLDWPLTGALDGSSPATPGCLTIFVPPRNIPTQRSTPKCDTLHHWPPPIQEKYRTFFFVIFHDIAILLLIPGWQGVFVCGPFGHIARAVIYVNYIAI